MFCVRILIAQEALGTSCCHCNYSARIPFATACHPAQLGQVWICITALNIGALGVWDVQPVAVMLGFVAMNILGWILNLFIVAGEYWYDQDVPS